MTLDTPHFTTLDDALNDRSANPDVALDYGSAPRDRATLRVASAQLDLADDTTLMVFVHQRNRDAAQKNRGRFADKSFYGIDDLRVAVLAAGESWPPRRQWFSGYAAAFGITL